MEKAKNSLNKKSFSEMHLQFPKLHKCVMYHYKNGGYIGKVHAYSFPGKGETIAVPYEDEITYYKVKKRVFTANTLDKVLECALMVKPFKTEHREEKIKE